MSSLGERKGESRLYEPVEIAYLANLKQATVQRYCRDGGIEAIKLGTRWRVTREEVQRFLKEGPRST